MTQKKKKKKSYDPHLDDLETKAQREEKVSTRVHTGSGRNAPAFPRQKAGKEPLQRSSHYTPAYMSGLHSSTEGKALTEWSDMRSQLGRSP